MVVRIILSALPDMFALCICLWTSAPVQASPDFAALNADKLAVFSQAHASAAAVVVEGLRRGMGRKLKELLDLATNALERACPEKTQSQAGEIVAALRCKKRSLLYTRIRRRSTLHLVLR